MSSTESKPQPTVGEILDKAAKSAMRGGTAGAVAMGLNVGALMWMRTTVRFVCSGAERSPSTVLVQVLFYCVAA